MTKTAREILHNFALNYRVESKESRNQCLDQALKELEAIHQQEIAKARLNEAQLLYEDAINSTSHGHITYARKRVERHLETIKELEAEL